jgi:hypothetical protein
MATQLIAAEVDRSLVAARIAELELQLQAERELLAGPREPVPMHSVIRFLKFDQKYTYAAIKSHIDSTGRGVWHTTQDGTRSPRQGVKPMYWEDLIKFIGQRNWARVEVLG